MAIPGIGATPPATQQQSSSQQFATAADDVIKQFMDYMKETPAQRMQDKWLAAHGISKEKFAAMSDTEKQKILDQMRQDLELAMKQQMENNLAKRTANI